MSKVLLTGADGFIGSHLAEALVDNGFDVRAFVLYNSFDSYGWLDHISSDARDRLDIFVGDIRDPHGVRRSVQGCDTVVHLAALIGIPYSYHSPDTYVDTNIRGTLNLLQAARESGVARFLHTSTSEVYGSAQFVPITEEHPLQGQSPYSATKIGADQLALSFYNSFGFPVVVIRPFNAYGPRQSTRAVIPTIITQIASGADHIKLGSLSPTRDFTYVTDTASAFVAALKSEDGLGEVFNVGSNFEISIGELTDQIRSIFGTEVEIEADDERIRPAGSEVDRLWADTSKFLDTFDWSPSFGGLEGLSRGLGLTAKWFSDPANLRRYRTGQYTI